MIAPHRACRDLAGDLLMLLQESLPDGGDSNSPIAVRLKAAQKTVARFCRRLDRVEQVGPTIALAGLGNVGKSTLLNAILGADLAPCRNGPCTAVSVEFRGGSPQQVVVDRVNEVPWIRLCSNHQAVRHILDLLAKKGAVHESDTIERICVQLEHPLFSEGLVMMDTPGFGAALLESADNLHEQALLASLQEVAQVIWVVRAEQGIGWHELKFWQEQLADWCDDLVITGCEDWSDRELQKFQQKYEPYFGRHCPQFHFVSGKAGIGIEELKEHMRILATPQSRCAHVMQSLAVLAQELSYWRRRLPLPRQQDLWRPDSWRLFCRGSDPFGWRQTLISLLDP